MEEKKTKIEYWDGCTTTGVYINDEGLTSMDFEEIKKLAKEVIDKIDRVYPIQEFLIAVAEELGVYEDIGTCEQCGDTIYKYTYTC